MSVRRAALSDRLLAALVFCSARLRRAALALIAVALLQGLAVDAPPAGETARAALPPLHEPAK